MSETDHDTGLAGVLADRVDGEPPAILGLSTTELVMVAVTVGLVCLPAMLVVGALLGALHIALMLAGFAFLGGVWAGAAIFRRLKRGRPLGYYQVRFTIAVQRWIGRGGFVLRGGHWDIGRYGLGRYGR